MANKTILLFLDFDGVLHPADQPIPRSLEFTKLPLLESWLRTYSQVNVVISSSWREDHTLQQLRAIFSTDLQSRIIGTCPVDVERTDDFWRYQEIMAWIDRNEYFGAWLALDDAEHEFPPGCEQLVTCDIRIGINGSVMAEITDKLNELTLTKHSLTV